ncbi:tRNA wybutosine-synthesizing protein [Bombardia bombarda]|uniref:tRNA(Phe) 7-[(3-amino-3-carboxypropyl)-4-demethylwyosine(37)-N(4)]-methyltransferase n=1 Tax=Bombardia bombarda TaxID=252184 RepID=A0AA39WCK3_9PEZI|nr:tRNA wybutosine-synthesizing protein [Bombardia bombarda]
MKTSLPHPGSAFRRKKMRILEQLSMPDGEYADASPKGSVDIAIRCLIDEINEHAGLVTTSSCAGRVSVYLEGRRKEEKTKETRQTKRSPAKGGIGDRVNAAATAAAAASSGGGKGGGEWLFVSHDPLPHLNDIHVGGGGERGLAGFFGLGGSITAAAEAEGQGNSGGGGLRLIHFKFEPMILHVLTASHEHAQLVVQAGIEAGFRETGAVSLLGRPASEEATPMVAVRCMGLSFESLVGMATDDGIRYCIVSQEYLELLFQVANARFVENQKRIIRFRAALKTAFAPSPPPVRREGSGGGEWEDEKTRKERKREEGLRRREELQRQKDKEES